MPLGSLPGRSEYEFNDAAHSGWGVIEYGVRERGLDQGRPKSLSRRKCNSRSALFLPFENRNALAASSPADNNVLFAAESAPCLAAFVASSWIVRDKFCTCCGVSATGGPLASKRPGNGFNTACTTSVRSRLLQLLLREQSVGVSKRVKARVKCYTFLCE